MRRPGKIALLSVLLVLVLFGVAYAVGRAGNEPDSAKQVQSSSYEDVSGMVRSARGGCRVSEDPSVKVPRGLFGPAHRILINSTVIGCGRRLGRWLRLVVYLQADHRSRQLCYGLEQPSINAKSGGACVRVSAAVPICNARCQVSANGHNPVRDGASKVTVVSGAVDGSLRNLMLSVASRSLVPKLRPIAAVMSGNLARRFGLGGDVSIFAYLVEPCLTEGQKISVVAGMEGGRSVDLRGSALAECG
jgi:hypothetical protein